MFYTYSHGMLDYLVLLSVSEESINVHVQPKMNACFKIVLIVLLFVTWQNLQVTPVSIPML